MRRALAVMQAAAAVQTQASLAAPILFCSVLTNNSKSSSWSIGDIAWMGGVALYGAYAADVNLDSSALKDAAVDCSTTVEFYLYPTVGTVLIHSVKPELTE